MNPLRIALHGLSGSGKSAVCSYLCETYGMTIASTGLLCRKVCGLLFGSESREYLNEVSAAMRGISTDIWIDAALREAAVDRVVFDSIRYKTDLIRLRNEGFSLWTVSCPAEVARARLAQRGQVFNVEDLDHESEISLLGMDFDVNIDNGDRIWREVCRDIDAAVIALGR